MVPIFYAPQNRAALQHCARMGGTFRRNFGTFL